MSSAAGMPGAIVARSCGVKRAAVYQRRRPERTGGCKSALREFALVRQQPNVAMLALDHWAESLAGRAIFLLIGNCDGRVSSAACVRFGLRLTEIEEAREMTNSMLQLHVVAAEGHSLGVDWRKAGAEFLLAQV